MNNKSKGIVPIKVKLRGAVVTADDEHCFLVILRLKDLQ
jgi:hypothetical protein